MAYSKDLRVRVVEAWNKGNLSYDAVGEQFGVGRTTVNRWLRLQRETGTLERKAHGGGYPQRIQGKTLKVFEELLSENPRATRAELTELLMKKTRLSVSVATVGRTLRKLRADKKKTQDR